MSPSFRPLARTDGLLTEPLDDELLIYDETSHVGIRLNRTAELVWRAADGERSVADLVETLRVDVEEADEDLVLITLDRLAESDLIASGYTRRAPEESRLSRRRFIRRVGVVGTAALSLPVVMSVAGPIASAAASTGHPNAEGACYCPCVCGCAGYSSCGTCDCTPCANQLGYCLSCSSCTVYCICGDYSPESGTCKCGGYCGYCRATGWYCGSCTGGPD